jgi:hypothetical protein
MSRYPPIALAVCNQPLNDYAHYEEATQMTIGTFTLLTLTGSLVLLKLSFMAFALILMAKALFPAGQLHIAPAKARLLPLQRSSR